MFVPGATFREVSIDERDRQGVAHDTNMIGSDKYLSDEECYSAITARGTVCAVFHDEHIRFKLAQEFFYLRERHTFLVSADVSRAPIHEPSSTFQDRVSETVCSRIDGKYP
jgi:hypothetical protein